jgi:hypothetical protein
MNIAKREIGIDTTCPVCLRYDEDGGHYFFLKCKFGHKYWLLLNMEEATVQLAALPSA